MNNEEAIKLIKEAREDCTSGEDEPYKEAFGMAILAVEKQIPKKPIIEMWSPTYCPSCGEELSESIGDGYYQHFTSLEICDCGQKLDWN